MEPIDKTSRKRKLFIICVIAAIIATSGILLIIFQPLNPSTTKVVINSADQDFTVYRSADCACCGEYAKYLQRSSNLNVVEAIIQNLTPYRNVNVSSKGLESCHVSVVGPYFVEGHVPLESIKSLLEERPNIVGIALPEMPSGSPGMGGVKSVPFVIYALFSNGTSTIFQTI